jgi:hypothetical protein
MAGDCEVQSRNRTGPKLGVYGHRGRGSEVIAEVGKQARLLPMDDLASVDSLCARSPRKLQSPEDLQEKFLRIS